MPKSDGDDPRFPGGMDYLDWLMNVLKPDELTPKNVDEIIVYQQKACIAYESGAKIKKSDVTIANSDLIKRFTKPKPKLFMRPL